MNVPKLRFKEFNDEWKENKLHDIAKITMGQSPNSENYTYDSSDTLLIQGNADLYNGKVIPRLFTKQITKTCDKKDIIMTVRAPVGDIAISDYYACIGRGVCSIKSSKFIYNYLDYLKEKGYWKKISKGSTIDSITSDNIKSLVIKTPSRKEQEKIIRTIDLINKKIELQTRKIEALKLFKLCILKHIFSSATVKTKLKNVSNITKGEQINSEELSKSGSYYMLNGGTKPSGYLEKYNTLENTITISEGGNSCGYVKYNKYKFWCGGHCYSIKSKLIDNHYLYQLLKFNEKKIMRLRIGSGLPNIQKKNLENFELFIHEKNNQYKIANLLMKYDTKIELEKNKLDKLTSLKIGLLQNMFI